MLKKILPLLALSLIVTTQAHAASNSNDQRIRELEYQIRLLTQRVDSLERELERKHDYERHDQMYQCQMSVFGSQYKGRSSSRGKAITKVVNQCISDHDEMFCRPDAVRCKTF
ncbi:hypothetical protein C9J03_23800 [Photobacterium gaetbulicola]|uniref:Putative periplasmic protein n=1 Tax=Photobacterium gaetbulicola Gung47 TaxID=658445 RepID=A0A0C5WX61_9GAMM|nr:hypothetical protein [Photobacterium gaetbulicola]AJR07670.1 putative periplasmic protein [Photobacterium gaetbulicola Gung47]PSU02434.1 hypothetical protein C9J03_23800 [Photobacterium gaetbulicola]